MKQDPLRYAQAIGGTLAVLGLIIAMLASMLVPDVTLPDRFIGIYILLISSLLAVPIPLEKKDRIMAALSGAIEGWAAANEGGDEDG